ncbi:MAG: MOSC domain-containing protein [gamma proteobacterium symbiont of Bathyaustriella thionipta]|nr:MOSC domain-containing protein [gamma proteobacterium symbiont of Bathyaustriella thionipta]MCU7951026.1 MOSC domain-containing protein [gamma proteobacterium symbiont of Bathyaustriella thionipta]MCU7953981.1 MOSC domain-containing protein [gamma proteobacterium symbiont of Bathyaustriella thionipta]MCU7957532.1 MOSC domain-containing protein [gamma proteobacterium symbiont of Bathyaustriella thionipta]MCU7968618.1 MOSC domain-containing protein [gamma proteobacterium symbiont of Bathyaustr
MKKIYLSELRTGTVKPLSNSSVMSAIDKRCTRERLKIGLLGLSGDEQADRLHHGGKDKAIHHYAAEHYDYWQTCFPDNKHRFRTGSFGENFSTQGMTEQSVCVGDIYRAGSALLQVSQARQPCWKLNSVFQQDDMARQVQSSLRTGWYYRVLETGNIAVGDHIELLERPEPEWLLSRLLVTFYQQPLDRDSLTAITELTLLTEGWKKLAANRLVHQKVEDWTQRLEGNQSL